MGTGHAHLPSMSLIPVFETKRKIIVYLVLISLGNATAVAAMPNRVTRGSIAKGGATGTATGLNSGTLSPNGIDSTVNTPSLVSDGLETSTRFWNTSRIDFSTETRDGARYAEGAMNTGDISVKICRDHFPSGSAARAEIIRGIDYFKQVDGLDLQLNTGGYDHQSIDDRFEAFPTRGEIKIDYAYNSGNAGYIPCHKPKSDDLETRIDEQWGFTANACSNYTWGWGNFSSNKTNASRISVNPLKVTYSAADHSEIREVRYRHFWDVSGERLPYPLSQSTGPEYPRSPLFSHELGHSLGLLHTPDWPAALGMISSMQSHIRTITPFDLAYLKYEYGLTSNRHSSIRKKDLTVSHLVRYDRSETGDKDFRNYDFGTDPDTSLKRINPLHLYPSDGQYLDCRTRQSPRFHATWFNNGIQEITDSDRVVGQWKIQPLASRISNSATSSPPAPIQVHAFRIGSMEGLS